MSTLYTANAANATGTVVAITEPEDGDPLTAASETVGTHLLADWAQRLADISLNIATTAWTFTLGIVFTLRATFNDGVLVNAPSTSNRNGVEGTGNGTGRGGFFTGGSSSGSGVRAIGGASNGAGVDASAGGTGIAVYGENTGSGFAVQADASAGTGTALDVLGNSTAPAATFTAGGSQDAAQFTGTTAFSGLLSANGGIAHPTPLVVGGTGASFQNSFAAGGGQAPRYWKDAFGVVHIDGGVTNTTTPGAAAIVFTLPSGSRPSHQLAFSVCNVTAQSQVDCVVETNGDFKVNYAVANELVYFDGITFATF